MIGDPIAEVLDVSRRVDDAHADTVAPVDRDRALLARRRFGVALSPPLVPRPADPAALPIRPGGPHDAAAVAAVQRRAWRVRYRGLLSDAFLDELDFSYLGAYWSGRAAVAPTPRHRLLVAGRPGEVHGLVDVGPARDDDAPRGDDGLATWGEVRSLYLDPTVFGSGLGAALLDAAVATLRADDRTSDRLVLWVVDGNAPARRFYERHGWTADGATKTTPVADEELAEVRYARPAPG